VLRGRWSGKPAGKRLQQVVQRVLVVLGPVFVWEGVYQLHGWAWEGSEKVKKWKKLR